ncbi:angiopoietin-related protein 6 isoform X1 [Aquarana catesbeiana]|uniref:angiopoietin-related protein 6 isoform X1 n=1 Tax=Aquarana catesbeiana TaxID=8400 RepID=UPI003CCA63DF
MNFYIILWLAFLPDLCYLQLAFEYSENNGASRPKCTYTFVVPQQKITGAVCISTAKFPEAFGVNRSEVEELKQELSRQQTDIEMLKKMVDVDHEVATEMDHLRKENRNMGSRLSHFRTQFFHEVHQRNNKSTDVIQEESRGINATAEVLKLASKYKDLQEMYNVLASLVNNQSITIARLEEQCIQTSSRHQADKATPSDADPIDVKKKQNRQIHEEERDHIAVSKEGPQTQSNPDPSTTPSAPVVTEPEATKSTGPWVDCYDALLGGQTTSGIYLLKPRNSNQIMQAWCEQSNNGGGWTVIQKRQDGSINFFTTWQNYKNGFGNLDSEYWLGLENIFWLANQDSYKLLILMEDWQGRQASAEYDHFRLEPESDFYRLRLGQYRGTAGDSLSWHNDKQFSTLDKDRDSYLGNCAHFQKGGWWYNMCAHSNLNGVWYRGGHYRSRYQDGVYWAEFRGGAYSLKKVSMLIRPNK